jgi:hypothetical protein
MRTTLLVGAVAVGLVVAFARPIGAIDLPRGQQASGAASKQAQDTKKPQGTTTDKQGARTTPAPPSASQSGPIDIKAILEAGKIQDPAKRAAALEKALNESQSKMMTTLATGLQGLLSGALTSALSGGSAGQDVIVALAGVVKDDNKRLLDAANRVINAAPPNSRAQVYNSVADKFMTAGVLLDEAEDFANKSIAGFDEKKHLETAKKQYADMMALMAKMGSTSSVPPPPTDETILKDLRAQKAISQTTLGEIYMKKGRTADAEKIFKEIYAAKPSAHSIGMAAGYLADIAKKAGRDAEVVDYLSAADANGTMTAERRKDLEASYKALHNGSIDGLDAMLDARYLKDNPNHVRVQPYTRAAARSDRVVLAELFTGAGCPPCVGADMAFDGALERYKRQDVALLVYHLHIPRPDPMTNPSTLAREKFYTIHGVPAFWIDGESVEGGGGTAEMAQKIYDDRVQPALEKRLAMKADLPLALQAAAIGSKVSVKVEVGKSASPAKHLKLQIALVEEQVRYAGENGVRFHPMVVRSLGGKDALGFTVEPGKSASVEHIFDLDAIIAANKTHLDDFEAKNDNFGKFQFSQKKHEMDRARLAVVAFVQDEDTKKVLQAAFFKLGPAGAKTD